MADVGCGPGSWLRELGAYLPDTCELHGYDISPDQFPAAAAANVKFEVADARTRWSQEYRGKYDLVHLQLLVCGLEEDDWAKVARNAAELLKPGGMIQWVEGNFMSATRALRGKDGSKVSAMNRLGAMFYTTYKNRFPYGWSSLPGIFEDLGLQRVETDLVSSDRVPETRADVSLLTIQGIFGALKGMSAAGHNPQGMTMEQIEGFEDTVRAEIRSGAYVRHDIHVVVGFKPEVTTQHSIDIEAT